MNAQHASSQIMNGYHNTVAIWLDCPTAKSGVLPQSLGPHPWSGGCTAFLTLDLRVWRVPTPKPTWRVEEVSPWASWICPSPCAGPSAPPRGLFSPWTFSLLPPWSEGGEFRVKAKKQWQKIHQTVVGGKGNLREAKKGVVLKLVHQRRRHCGFVVVIPGLKMQTLSGNSAKKKKLESFQIFF